MFSSQNKNPTITLTVDDLRCMQCEATIKIALQKVAGVKRVRIQRRKEVIVEVEALRPGIKEELIQAIEASGYRVMKA
jgi:copper chaperone CopZ